MKDDIDELVAAHKADTHAAPAHLKQQWHNAIDEAATLERGRETTSSTAWHPGSFFWGMAISAALAVGIAIGFFIPDADIDSDAKSNPTRVRLLQIADCHRVLDGASAENRVDGARELGQKSIAHRLHDAPVMLVDRRLE